MYFCGELVAEGVFVLACSLVDLCEDVLLVFEEVGVFVRAGCGEFSWEEFCAMVMVECVVSFDECDGVFEGEF